MAIPAAITVDVSCPFIGLRPFDEADAPWFFGRDEQVDELLRRLASTRFLAVIGTSGCGKSSLVRAGLVPSLKRGYLSDAGTRWKVAVMRPGSDPFGALTRALDDPSVLGPQEDRPQTLRRSSRGCVECVRPDLGENESLLLVVDQFEEIFRFRKETLIGSTDDQVAGTDDQADAFVKLLLASCEQDEVRIYVVLTMRSDYLGDCAVFRGLPEALNDAQYIVPVLTRRQLLEVIEEPVISAGGEMAPELVQRVLNDVGHELEQELDQLPVLEHALMRTWQESAGESSIQLEHYSRAGRMSGALNQHAKQLYSELSEPQQAIAKRVFQRLTEKETAGRDIRRPTSFGELREVTGASREELAHVIEHFRDFLYSSDKPPFTDRSMVDITHEALIRQWEDLRDWAAEESHSAEVYGRLAYDAGRNARKWEDPDLTEALRLRDTDGWNETWAKRYTPSELVYGQADKFLAESKRHRFRKKVGRIGLVVLVAALLAGAYFYQIRLEQVEARAQQALAQAARAEADKANLQLQAEAKAAEAEQLLAKAAQSSDAEAEELRRRANELAKQSEFLKTNAEDYQTRESELEGDLKEARGTIEGLKGLVKAGGGEQAKEVLADVRGKLARAERESADLKAKLAEAGAEKRAALVVSLFEKTRKGSLLRKTKTIVGGAPRFIKKNPKDGLEYVWIPPGEFQMGCVPGDKLCDDDEEPRHRVEISKGFWLGLTEVTVAAYQKFAQQKGISMPASPGFNSGWKKEQHPLVRVTWNQADRFCRETGGRLPRKPSGNMWPEAVTKAASIPGAIGSASETRSTTARMGRRRWPLMIRMASVSMIWRETSGSGVRIGTTRITTRTSLRKTLKALPEV